MSLANTIQTLPVNSEFFQKTVDCLRAHIAILDETGKIIAVNSTWNRFATSNGLAAEFCGPGANYLRSCDHASGDCSDEAKTVANGIRDVIAGRQEHFYLEYPCHSPDEQRWFSVRVTRFEIGRDIRVVVSHDNITQRKIAEIESCEANRLLGLMATTDGLTGIPNRRCFDQVYEQEWKRQERLVAPLSVAMLDVDCFKQFNDHYGHLNGDDCLRDVAQTLRTVVSRAGDFVARYGGEEFALILPNAEEGAGVVLERVVRAVRELAIPHAYSKLRRGIVTVSIGCATAIPTELETPADLLRRADEALYLTKSQGRDQWVYTGVEQVCESA